MRGRRRALVETRRSGSGPRTTRVPCLARAVPLGRCGSNALRRGGSECRSDPREVACHGARQITRIAGIEVRIFEVKSLKVEYSSTAVPKVHIRPQAPEQGSTPLARGGSRGAYGATRRSSRQRGRESVAGRDIEYRSQRVAVLRSHFDERARLSADAVQRQRWSSSFPTTSAGRRSVTVAAHRWHNRRA